MIRDIALKSRKTKEDYIMERVEKFLKEAETYYLATPSLQKMYSADDGNTEVFYFKNATATFSSFTHEPEVVKL